MASLIDFLQNSTGCADCLMNKELHTIYYTTTRYQKNSQRDGCPGGILQMGDGMWASILKFTCCHGHRRSFHFLS